jgi:16S rRNA (uracil1498-N3)-methyltransferase
MPIFYDPSISGKELSFMLNADESAHACRVLRMKEGDKLTVLNGKGLFLNGIIAFSNPKGCEIKTISVVQQDLLPFDIHIAIAPTKNSDRMEWLFEKATEIGITEITLLSCRNSERKYIREDRLEKILVSAMKQSQRSFLPILHPMRSVKDFIKANPNGLIAHCENSEKGSIERNWRTTNCPILIGPEGDFSHEEIEWAISNGYHAISLGENRLRTETAGLVACMHAVLSSQKIKTSL